MPELWLIRHGETAWSLSGKHTGRTDVPLTGEGRRRAAALGGLLRRREFAQVLSSPFSRARETCLIAAPSGPLRLDEDLLEWDYGHYEGLTTAEIRLRAPGWTVWRDGVPGGETIDEVAARARRSIARRPRAATWRCSRTAIFSACLPPAGFAFRPPPAPASRSGPLR